MIKFIYDAEGIRKGKIESGGEVKYLMDGLAVLCEYDGSGDIKREYVPGISMKENGKTYYYITDRLGNVRYVVDSSGSVIQSYLYSPFGKIHTSSGSLTQPYQYVGGEFYYTEEDIGLKLLGQRWYDSGVGRFISRDPIHRRMIFANNNIWLLPHLIDLPQFLWIYSYASNNPSRNIDPLGLWCGPGEVGDKIIPDKWFGVYDFSMPCFLHDLCYASCAFSKDECDRMFYDRMLDECNRLSLKNPMYYSCLITARTYYLSVRTLFGRRAFNRAQRRNCSDCGNSGT